jgi:sugar phosphate isomerase/epimerase
MDIGFQLYSARSFPLDSTLKTLAKAGYTQVEGFGGVFGDPAATRRALDANGLAMPSAHFGLDLLDKPDEVLKIADALGVEVIICPWLPPHQRPGNADGWRKLGDRLDEVAKPYLRAGKGFAYHNHDFEFAPFGGGYAMDLLLEHAPSIGAEVDVAWIVRGGANPKPWLEKNAARIVAIHVKDVAAPGENKDEDGWADVGHGVVPWTELWPVAKKTAAKYFIAEHDNPRDVERFASRSIAAIRSFGD